jgi:BMFP domain-containing protein YqiC
VSAIALVDHVVLSQLSADVRPQESEIAILHERVAALEAQLDGIAGKPPSVSESRFNVARQAWDARLAQLEEEMSGAVRRDELTTLHNRLNAIETRLAGIRQTRPAATPRPRPAPAEPAKAPEVVVAPFTVLGIDVRGGELFLSLAPLGTDSLSQVHVLRVGETYDDWRLEKLDAAAAEFRVGERSIRLELSEDIRK